MPTAQEIQILSPQELKKFLETHGEDEYELIDVRQPAEYRQEHLPGSRLIPLAQIEESLPDLDPDKETVFYCRSGSRSMLAARQALDSGLLRKPVYQLDGGLNAWDGYAVPDAPRIDVFKAAACLPDKLRRALEMEKAAFDLYTDIQAKAPRKILCALMRRLVDMEIDHARQVHEKLLAREPDIPPFETYFKKLRGDVLESGHLVADLAPWIDAALEGDCMDVAELGLEIEFGAYDLYRAIARDAREGDEREAFLDLASQEKDHGRLIIQALDSLLENHAG